LFILHLQKGNVTKVTKMTNVTISTIFLNANGSVQIHMDMDLSYKSSIIIGFLIEIGFWILGIDILKLSQNPQGISSVIELTAGIVIIFFAVIFLFWWAIKYKW